MGKPMHFSYDEVYHRMEIRWWKSTHTMGKVWLPISQVLPIRWVLFHFPMLWEIDGKTQAFPISWDSLIFTCESGRKYKNSAREDVLSTNSYNLFYLRQWKSNPSFSTLAKSSKYDNGNLYRFRSLLSYSNFCK